MPAFTTAIKHGTGSPCQSYYKAKKKKRERKSIHVGKKKKMLKPSLFIDGMVLYLENPKEPSRNLQ